MKQKLKIILFLVMAVYFGYRVYQIYFYTPAIEFDKLKLKTLNNQPHIFNSKHLQSSIIIFFQTWCGPCVAEMKLIQKHYSQFQFTNIYFISDEPIEKLNRLKQHLHLDSLNILYSEDKLENIGIQAFPTSYILKNNKIIETHKGIFIDESNLEDEIFHLKEMLQSEN